MERVQAVVAHLASASSTGAASTSDVASGCSRTCVAPVYYRGTGEMVANPYSPGGVEAGLESGAIAKVDVEIQDVRGRDHSLTKQGYILVKHDTAVTDWADDAQITEIYYKEIAELAQQITGAKKCVVASHIMRSTDTKPGQRPTAFFIHNDFCDAFGEQLQCLMDGGGRTKLTDAGVTPEELQGHRLQMLSFWRSASGGPILRRPLAVVDATSIAPEDLGVYEYHPAGLRQKDWDMPLPVLLGTSTPSPTHKWGFYPDMQTDEVLVKLQYDSGAPSPHNGVGVHVAFDDPNTPEDAPARVSNEVRVFCLH